MVRVRIVCSEEIVTDGIFQSLMLVVKYIVMMEVWKDIIFSFNRQTDRTQNDTSSMNS